MKFIYALETGTDIPHCQFKRGIAPATVEAVFHLGMRDIVDGNHRVRFCKAGSRQILKVAYDWVVVNKKVKIFSAYYI